MVSDRIQRRIDALLDEADAAVAGRDWEAVRSSAEAVLAFDGANADALAYMAAADKARAGSAPAAGGQTQDPAGSPLVQAAPPTLPTSFANSRYQVRRFLGEGGKKRVYLAHDSLLDRDVAFALIKTEGLDDEGRERITREAQAMGKLGTHPHLVTVHDIGEEGGQPYLVTEFMAGGDVEGLLEKADDHRLPIESAVELATQVCRGLEFAHEHGLVHRDLKPGNVWLNADGTAKIGDFGLAVALDRSRLTQAGMMVGTVAYMPPEQAVGGEVTPRSDLYSLGCMLYEMVCGRPPFVGEESVAIITQHLNTPPVAPTWHRSDCPAGLEALVLRLLEKDAGKRPASASEVRRALEGGVARPPSVTLPQKGGEDTQPGTQGGENPLYRRTFVGREVELRQLQAAFDGAVSGQGALLMVVGEPGIGKTALCEQLATYATVRGGRELAGHCYEEGSLSLPYLPFVEAIRSYVLTRPPDDLKQELGSGATEVARIVSEIREKVAVELRVGGDPEDDRWRLFQAVTGFLRNASAVQPLLVILEDLHWADRGTLDFLVHLSRNLSGARLLLVGTYRDIEVDRAHPLSAALAELRRTASFGRISLRGLTPDEVHRMLNSLTEQEIRWSLAEAVHRQTEGNPLFIQEVLRYLVEEGLITRDTGRLQRGGEAAPEMHIPEGLRDVIGKRLSRLSAQCNELLAVAAVVGRDFDLETLRRVTEVGEEALLKGLEEAVRVGVLEETARPGMVRYRFSHAFFRQTLYEEMIAPRRLRLHQQVARALEAQHPGRLEEHAAELAEHFAQSTDPADLGQAVRYGEMAAGRATGVYAYSEAGRLLEQALGVQRVLDPGDKARQCDVLVSLGEALLPAGEPLRVAEEVASAALDLAEALGDRERASHACRLAIQGLARYGASTTWGTPAFRQWAERSDRYADPGTAARVNADLALARVRQADGRFGESWTLCTQALALARQLNVPDLIFDSARLVMQSTMPARYEDDRLHLAEEITSFPEAGVSARLVAQVLDYSGNVFLQAGDRARAQAQWGRLEELGARTRDPDITLRSVRKEVWVACLDGRLEEAIELAGRFASRAEEHGASQRARAQGVVHPYRELLYLGKSEEALAAARRIGDDNAAWRVAVCLAYTGRHLEAREAIRALVAQYRIDTDESDAPTFLLGIALEAAVESDDVEMAALLAPRLAGHASRFEGGYPPIPVARNLGKASSLLGDPDKARSYYEESIQVCTRVQSRPELALTRLQLAELLLEHYPDERAEALNHLDFAITEFREMKMQPTLERALKHKGLLHA